MDLDVLFDGFNWLHLSGITPAIGGNCPEVIMTMLKTAKELGLTTSFDGNFRSKLWTWEEARDYCTQCLPYVDVLLGIEPYHLWKDENDHSKGDWKDGVPLQPSYEQQDEIFQHFIERYPNSKRVEAFSNLIIELTERLKKKAYLNAYTYFKIGRYKSAIVAFKNSMRRYPESPRTEDMMYYITVSAYRLAANSIESKQVDRYLNMLDYYYSYLAEYPESERLRELERMARDARNFLDRNRTTTEATVTE